MSGLILCSKKSDTPYRIADADINIYSIEEFAYYLYNNAYFVDDNFFNEDLVKYIEMELNLPKIAQKLKYAMGQKQSFAELVMLIINSSMYYDEAAEKKFEKELRVIGSKGMLERMKARADMLMENGKLGSAKKTLTNILADNMYKKPGPEFYSEVYVSLGKIDCRMFYFEEGIENYKTAYELNPSDDILIKIVDAKLLNAFVDEVEPELEEERNFNNGIVEKCIEDFESGIREITEGEKFQNISKNFLYDGRHNLDDYYENVLSVLDEWKSDYRNDMA